VIDGQIVSVTNVVHVPSPDPSERPPDQPDLSQFKTIEDLFGVIQVALLQPVDVLAVSYDPMWSFPRRISIDQLVQSADDEIEYAVSDLRPIATATASRDERANTSAEPAALSRSDSSPDGFLDHSRSFMSTAPCCGSPLSVNGEHL
jgi:hypothetical protein